MFLIIVSVLLTGISQLLLKLGVENIDFNKLNLELFYHIITNYYILLGIFCMGVSILTWLFVLKNTDVSLAYPFVSINFIFLLFAGYLFFNEPINVYKIVGTLFIILGIIFIYYFGNQG